MAVDMNQLRALQEKISNNQHGDKVPDKVALVGLREHIRKLRADGFSLPEIVDYLNSALGTAYSQTEVRQVMAVHRRKKKPQPVFQEGGNEE